MNKWNLEVTPEMVEAALDNRASQPAGTLPGSAMRQMFEAMIAASDHIVDANKKVGAEWDKEGQPANLEGAAEDAHHWLTHIQKNVHMTQKNIISLNKCIKQLRIFLDER